MDESGFETLLQDAAPQPSAPVGLGAHRQRILSEAGARRSRRARAWVGGVAATALFLGGGSAAMAASGYDTPWGWVADNVFSIPQADGKICFQGLQVMFEGIPEDSDMVRDARKIVNGIDLAKVDTSAYEAQVRKDNAEATTEDGKPAPITMSDAELKQVAIHRYVADTLFAELEALGYDVEPSPDEPTSKISLSSEFTEECTE